MPGIIPNLPGIMVGVGQNFPMSACEPTVQCSGKRRSFTQQCMDKRPSFSQQCRDNAPSFIQQCMDKQRSFSHTMLTKRPSFSRVYVFVVLSVPRLNGLFTSYTRLPRTCLFMKHQNMIPPNILHVQIFLTNIAQVTIS